ncbi:MAG: ParB/RepB/Spo0J family partition protein [Alphaproteobacteria bacterium]|nr:ParB/RepB/Spo0J family partition protein [Alphaproteobacteria bacterium]
MTTQIHDTRAPDSRASFIPIHKLSVHESNVRRTDKRTEIEALAASIEAHGLLQNLTVVAREDGRYAVVAGGRRLAALKLLAKEGRLARDFAAPCTLVKEAAASEASLAENVQRVAMNVMDEVEAFAALVAAGASIEDVARRFGTGTRRVEQRLALARLSLKIKAAYRKGEIGLDAARAFCLTDDHAQQEIVFKQMAKPIVNAASVRGALTQGRMPAHDRLARFVGVDAYREAGGHVVSDLFDEAAVFLDAETVRGLAHAKAETLREDAIADGWGWAEITLGYGRVDGTANERLRPIRRPMTVAEAAEHDRLQREIAILDESLNTTTDDDDPGYAERDAFQDDLDRLVAANEDWDPTLKPHAGVVISIDHDGAANIQCGVIKRGDLKAIEKLRRGAYRPNDDQGGAEEASSASRPTETCEDGPRLTKGLVLELTRTRTRALRARLAESPHTALAVLVHALSGGRRGEAPGIAISSRPAGVDDAEAVSDARDAWAAQVSAPRGGLEMCLSLPIDALLDALAVLVAETLDFSHAGVAPADRRLQEVADTLAAALDLDMTRSWRPDLAFWLQAPKAVALEALQTAPRIERLPPSEKTAMLAAFSRMKKPELAAAAAQALEGTGWLPDVLVAPTGKGMLALTALGEAAVSAAAAAAA